MGIRDIRVRIARSCSFSIRSILLRAISQENVETSNEPELVFLTRKNN